MVLGMFTNAAVVFAGEDKENSNITNAYLNIDDEKSGINKPELASNEAKEKLVEGKADNSAASVLRSPDENNVIKISSLEELKKHIEYKPIKRTESDTEPVERFVLKGGNYEIAKSFEIDLKDDFFKGKETATEYGLISAIDEISINGKGNAISFKQDESVALFGMINSPKYSIVNLKVAYPKNVSGFAFAQMLQSKDTDTGIATSNGIVKNVEVTVGGSVVPLEVIGNEKSSNHFIGKYSGMISAGFSWYIQNTNIENVNINIKGDIGSSKRPEEAKDMVAAYGLTHHFGNVPYTETHNVETWNQLHNEGNPRVLKDAGHIVGLNLNVGGNIQAYGNNTGYSAGVGQDMAPAWMEKVNINIGGDIITDLKGNTAPMTQSYTSPYAYGISDEVMNLTDSTLTVNNIIFNGVNLPNDSKLCILSAMANNNSKGNYINIKNNKVNVKGKIDGKSNQNIMSSIGFNNDWNSNGGYDSKGKMIDDGVDWVHENEDNSYEIGSINLESDKIVSFNALGKKWRTGQNPLGNQKLPEASLKNNKVKAGNITIKSKNNVTAALLMGNSSNAKYNTLNYGNIRIEAEKANFYGMGNLQNKQPTANFYNNIAENNSITMGNLTIAANEADYISLLAGYQAPEQAMKGCTVKAGKVNIQLNGTSSSYIGGMSGVSCSSITSCRVFADSIKVANKGEKNVYFGLGAARSDGAAIANSGIFVDGEINVQSKALYGGGFIGFAKNSNIEGNDFQVDGKNDIGLEKGAYGGFAGHLTDSTLKNSSSLILNDFMPFIGYSNGGKTENISHYVNGKAPRYFSGLIAGGKNNPTISNSTLLVEKKFEDTILYRKDSVSSESKDNYLVVVDDSSKHNRLAYRTAETDSTEEEMGKQIPVFKKTGEPIGKINIKTRSFQDKYWNDESNPYETGDAEKNFDYMTKNEAGKISVFGVDGHKIVSSSGAIGTLGDYYHRHAGLVADSGAVYDLLGIRGSLIFKVVYDGNGADKGSVPVDPSEYKFEDSVNVLPNDSLSRTKHEFAGWNTKADGSGRNYKGGDRFKITGDVILYGMWKKRPDTVTFIDGDHTVAAVKVETGKTIDNDDLTDESMPQDPTKNGYTFKEWNTQKDGKGTSFTGTTVVNEDIIVYAVYSKNAVVINEAPTLEVKDKTIRKGENLDLMSLVVFSKDKEEGDLTKDVKLIDDGEFDKDKPGKYTVAFKVIDKDGASATKKAVVTVVEKGESASKPDDNSGKTLPKTGDSSGISLYAVLLGLSGALLAVGIKRKKRINL